MLLIAYVVFITLSLHRYPARRTDFHFFCLLERQTILILKSSYLIPTGIRVSESVSWFFDAPILILFFLLEYFLEMEHGDHSPTAL